MQLGSPLAPPCVPFRQQGGIHPFPSARVAVLDESVREYEPHLALDGGNEGLKYIKKLVKQARNKLNPEGIIALEVDYTHDEKFLKEKLELDDLKLKTKQDQFQRMRFVILSKN